MLSFKQWLTVLGMAVVVALAACTNDFLDDGDGPDVILEIQSLANPPITAEPAAVGPGCLLQVVDWTASLRNRPKNSLAASAVYQDIILQDVTIVYTWFPGSGNATPNRVVGLGNVAIPASGSGTVTFSPMAFDDLASVVVNTTANLTLVFRAVVVEGSGVQTVTATVGRQLFIEGC